MKRKTAKEILAESFIELAQTKKIDKITVKDITENCGYSTATFYRQFRDKYDLIAWSYTQDIRGIVDKLEYTEGSWKNVLTQVAKYFEEQRDYLSNLLLHTSGYDSFVGNMTQIHFERMRFLILKVTPDNKLDEITEMYIRVYCYGTVHLTCEWILGKYKVSLNELTQVYVNTLPEPLNKYLL
ncbi:MAG: TetR/AcrR family transcriptional regulator C-terminal domain-containing protein [Eubacterium sp.]|nr:TetR/AcrR family transcriptional regulator C-terminal domain-containing protein [Eubacterium sp.]